jgi:hypothetical protein
VTTDGTLALNATTTPGDQITIDMATLEHATHDAGLASNFSSVGNYTWTIASAAGGIIGFTSVDQFVLNTAGFLNDPGSGTFSIELSEDSKDLQLVFSSGVVPTTTTWKTASADDIWSNDKNWDAGVPSGTMPAVFDVRPVSFDPKLTGEGTAKGVTFNSAGWTVGGLGQTLNIGADGLTSKGSGTNTIDPDVVLLSTQTWTVDTANVVSLSGSLTGTGNDLEVKGGGEVKVAGTTALANLTVTSGTATLGVLNTTGAVTVGVESGTKGILTASSGNHANLSINNGSANYSGMLTVENKIAVGSLGSAGSLVAGDTSVNNLHVINGSATLGNVTGTGTSPSITLADGTSATMNQFRTSSVTIGDGSTLTHGSGTSVMNSLSITGTGTFDLGSGRMVIDYADDVDPFEVGGVFDQVKAWVASGWLADGADWYGTGITSSLARDNPSLYTVAILDQGRLLNGMGELWYGEGGSISETFGDYVPDWSSILVKVTYRGDMDLDGMVGDAETTALGLNYGGSGFEYWQGDLFGFDGSVDDYETTMIGLTYGNGWLPGQGDPMGGLGGEGAIPEPATLALLGLGAIAALARRRRRG